MKAHREGTSPRRKPGCINHGMDPGFRRDDVLAAALQRALGGTWRVRPLQASGFCATWHAQGERAALFVKTLPIAQADVLEAEADGLAALAQSGCVRVPGVVHCGRDDALAMLALEWLDLVAPDRGFGARMGAALAALHGTTFQPGRYGWRRDNMLGGTPQTNRWSHDWVEFFSRERLGAMQARLTERAAPAALIDAVQSLRERLSHFFDDGHVHRASLIHGDLWSGNWGMLADGTPVVYDPAVSCSDHEAELAMMELFGTPPDGLWSAYARRMPLHPGYAQRRPLYQLYHLLNHALLFGGGYVSRSLALATTLSADR